LKALESEPFGALTHNVAAVLRYTGNRFEQVEVRDPANEDNVVSNDLSAKEKKAIAKVARDALYDENWKKILW
jgi:hypothetical protein